MSEDGGHITPEPSPGQASRTDSAPRYRTLPSEAPLWVSEPFRLFFPLGLAAGAFGLLLWPLYHLGWWPEYPAVQHPRMLVFGFGAAFVFGFLGTAWPRFLEAEALGRREVLSLAALWTLGQLAYAGGWYRGGDAFAALACLWLLAVLGRRLGAPRRDLPPPGFALAALSLVLAAAVLAGWVFGWATRTPEIHHLHRLLAYEGFLLLPILGVGFYLFPRFFHMEGARPPKTSSRRRALAVWGAALLVLSSFVVEVDVSARAGNLLRAAAVLAWAALAMPFLFHRRAPGTRPWALRVGLALIPGAFLCRALHTHPSFAYQHLLFLGGFTLVMLLVADRVVAGHAEDGPPPAPKSLAWRWIVWLLILTAATRATADLVPTTRVSHQIYASLTALAVFGIWLGRRRKKALEPRQE